MNRPAERPFRVLILEDVPTDAELMEAELRHWRPEVVTECVAAKDAFVKALDEFDPAIILSDFRLPQFDGMQALRLAQERLPDVPVIIVTGSVNEETAVECMQAGASDYVLKDHLSRLVPAIERVMVQVREHEGRRRTERALRESERAHRTLLSNIPGTAYRCRNDRERTMEFLSDGCEELTGYPPEELVHNHPRLFASLIHPDDRERVWESVQRSVERGGRFEIEYRLLTRDGVEKHVWERGRSVGSGDGEGEVLEGLVIDITDRWEVTEALRASEERFRIVFESAPNAMYLHDLDGVFVDGNRAAERLIGMPREQAIGKSLFSMGLIEPEQLTKISALLAKNASGLATGPEEFTLRQNGGLSVTVEIQAYPVEIDGTQLVLGIARDITERKEAEEAIERLSRRNALILNAAGEGIIGMESNGVVTFVNPTAAERLGHTAGNMIGRTICDVVEAGRHTPDACPMLRTIRAGEQYRTDMQSFTRADGTALPVRCTLAPMVEHGEVAGAVMMFEDVSERQRMERELRRSEAGYRSLFENAPFGVYRSNKRGFLAVNPALVRMLGYDSAEELLQVDLDRDVYAEPERRADLIAQHESPGEIEGVEVQWRRKDRKPLTVRLMGRATGEELHGSPVFEMMVEDVTDRKNLEAQLRQSQKMEAIGRLTGGIAHDFNNELSVILLNAQFALAALEQGQPVQVSDLQDIEDAAQSAAEMTRQLLGFSRQAELLPEPTDLARVVTKLSTMLRRLVPESISIRIDADGPVAAVNVDTNAIEQMLLNLTTNARDAMPDGGTLSIVVEETSIGVEDAESHPGLDPGAYVRISITDTGTGMDAETKSRAFEPFFTTKPVGVGTGLGLAMVYGLTKQQGGYASLYSEPGQGTTVRLYFPALDQVAAAVRVRDSAAAVRGGSETILVVEDEPALRRAAKRILERFGYAVLTAVNGNDAVRVFDEHRDEIDLVVSDLVMPKMSGWQLHQELRARGSNVPFILSSGYTGRDAQERNAIDPSVPFVQKPLRITDFVAQVRRALDGKV